MLLLLKHLRVSPTPSSAWDAVGSLQVAGHGRQATSYLVNQPVDAHGKEIVDIARSVVDIIRSHSQLDKDQLKLWVGIDYEALGFIGRIAFLEYNVRIFQTQVVEIIALDVVPKLRQN